MGSLQAYPPDPHFCKVLAAVSQFVPHELGQPLLQPQPCPFARLVVVGVDMEVEGFEQFDVPFVERRCRGPSHGLESCREHRPAVAAPLCDIERFAGLQMLEDGQVVDAHGAALGETETGERLMG